MRYVPYQTDKFMLCNTADMLFIDFDLPRLCVIAGNISPIDVITHLPILCEESGIPYIYVPTKEVSRLHLVFFCFS